MCSGVSNLNSVEKHLPQWGLLTHYSLSRTAYIFSLTRVDVALPLLMCMSSPKFKSKVSGTLFPLQIMPTKWVLNRAACLPACHPVTSRWRPVHAQDAIFTLCQAMVIRHLFRWVAIALRTGNVNQLLRCNPTFTASLQSLFSFFLTLSFLSACLSLLVVVYSHSNLVCYSMWVTCRPCIC